MTSPFAEGEAFLLCGGGLKVGGGDKLYQNLHLSPKEVEKSISADETVVE